MHWLTNDDRKSKKGWFVLVCGKHDAIEMTLYPMAEVGLENRHNNLRVSRAAMSLPIDRWDQITKVENRPLFHPWDQITGESF